MRPSEVTTLCAYIAAARPTHHLDAYAATVWAEILADVPDADAWDAAAEVLATREWIGPADVVAAQALRALDAHRR